MIVDRLETIVVSVPYRHREVSSQVERDGVTDVIIKLTASDGTVGWGESASGADVMSVEQAIQAMAPFVVGRSPWEGERIRGDLFQRGLWQFRPMTGNFAWAGIDMALWDLCGRSSGLPVHRFFGGPRRSEVDYFFYLARGDGAHLAAQCKSGLDAGFTVFYLKVGIDIDEEVEMVDAVRTALGVGPKIRLDANAAWSLADACRNLERLAVFGIDFVEQPVRESPITQMAEVRARSPIPICANEGLWTEADAYARITSRAADVVCFSPYWVGSLAAFHRLCHVAHFEGLGVCKHTHGELGIAAAAAQHILLTLPSIEVGNQQTAHVMSSDIVSESLPIAAGPAWGVIDRPGLGVDVDEAAVTEAADRFRLDGAFLPYQPSSLRVTQ
jgi:L-Ala-D/L-Glu epimerase